MIDFTFKHWGVRVSEWHEDGEIWLKVEPDRFVEWVEPDHFGGTKKKQKNLSFVVLKPRAHDSIIMEWLVGMEAETRHMPRDIAFLPSFLYDLAKRLR